MMNNLKILCVDDDPSIRKIITEYFGDLHYTVFSASDGEDLRSVLKKTAVDVILMDMVLPDADGLNLIRESRTHSQAPIIVISGKADTADKVIGLEFGADDYVTKPFSLRELEARIKTVMRRSVTYASGASQGLDGIEPKEKERTEASRLLFFGEWKFDPQKMEVFDEEGQGAGLTSGEFRLLELFLRSAGRVLSRDYLFQEMHGEELDVFDRSIDIQVARLRKKLREDLKDPKYIKTVRSVGYMFVGKISSVS